MKQIQPSYATFEQAKKLKEIGFDSYTNIGYSESGKKYYHQGGQEPVKNGQNYYEGRDYQGEPFLCSAPEQWEVVEWLRINHGIHVEVSCDVYGELWFVKLEVCSKEVWDDLDKRHKILTAHRKFNNEHKSKQEAYSAAFDYILNNLI
jgi:hypothetical protein